MSYRWSAFCIALSIVIANGAEMIIPWMFGRIIDALTIGAPNDAMQTAFFLIAVIAGLHLLGQCAWRVTGFTTAQFQPRVMQDLEERSFNYLIGHSYRFFTNQFAGSLIRKIRRLSRAYEVFADEVQFRFIGVSVLLTAALITLGMRFPMLAVVFFFWVLIFLYFNYRISLWVLDISAIRAEKDSEVTGTLADAITNVTTIKLFTGDAVERGYLHRIEDMFRVLQTRVWQRNEVAFAIQSLLVTIVTITILTYSVVLWGRGILTIGDLVLIQATLGIVVGKLWDISRAFRHIFESLADAREMVEIFEEPHEIVDRPRACALTVPKGKIEFIDVAFHYHQTRRVLDQLTMTVKPREKVALVGPSGAGKSTIVKLLFRFADVTGGKILIDGQDIAKVTQESLRQHIALVPQDPILFHRSLMENIRYGKRDATDDEVVEAAKKAHCHEFISELPKGYATLVGERGVKLSGGERQRVAIARAILKNPPILVLDEATSNLDSESEQHIQAALHELMREKTVIVIAHRLSTIMEMDRILVIEGGRVTATGSHTALLKRKGTYRRLWEIQAGGFRETA